MKRYYSLIQVRSSKGELTESLTIKGDILAIEFDQRTPRTLWVKGTGGYSSLPFDSAQHKLVVTRHEE